MNPLVMIKPVNGMGQLQTLADFDKINRKNKQLKIKNRQKLRIINFRISATGGFLAPFTSQNLIFVNGRYFILQKRFLQNLY